MVSCDLCDPGNRLTTHQEILKHPLRTAVSVFKSDFEQFEAQEKLHIIISVKDFKSIVNHADTLQNTTISAYYSTPGRPFQFSYSKDGIQCQFTLMTTGEYNGTPTPSAAPPSVPSAGPRSISRAQSTTSTGSESRRPAIEEMPPPAKPASRRPVRKLGQNENSASSQLRQQQEEDPDSLFVPAGEEDHRWEPANYENDEETLGWDASASNVCCPMRPFFTNN
jgi:cell cycle checkpoint control protein RAD9A